MTARLLKSTANSVLYCIKHNDFSLFVAAAHEDEITTTEGTTEVMMIVTITADHTGETIFLIFNCFLNSASSATFLPV